MIISEIIILLLPFSVGLALLKITVFGIPLYTLEILFLSSCLVMMVASKRQFLIARIAALDRGLLLGIGLFVLGAVTATLFNSPTLRSLGQLKSWVVFPLVFLGVLWLTGPRQEAQRKHWYVSLFVGLLLIALTAGYGLAQHVLTYDRRLAFPYTSPNFLAFMVSWGVILSLYLTFVHQSLWQRMLFGAGGLLFLGILYLTHSYNAWIGLNLALLGGLLGAFLLQRGSYRKVHLIYGSLFVILVVFATFFLVEHSTDKWQNLFAEDGRSSLDSRLMIWQSALMMAQDHPFFGIGLGNFQEQYLVYQKYFPPYLEWAVPQPHNLWLALWLQVGVLGMIGFGMVVWRVLVLLVKVLRTGGTKKEGLLHLLWLGFFLLYGFLDTPYFRNDLAFLFWFQILLLCWYLEDTRQVVS